MSSRRTRLDTHAIGLNRHAWSVVTVRDGTALIAEDTEDTEDPVLVPDSSSLVPETEQK